MKKDRNFRYNTKELLENTGEAAILQKRIANVEAYINNARKNNDVISEKKFRKIKRFLEEQYNSLVRPQRPAVGASQGTNDNQPDLVNRSAGPHPRGDTTQSTSALDQQQPAGGAPAPQQQPRQPEEDGQTVPVVPEDQQQPIILGIGVRYAKGNLNQTAFGSVQRVVIPEIVNRMTKLAIDEGIAKVVTVGDMNQNREMYIDVTANESKDDHNIKRKIVTMNIAINTRGYGNTNITMSHASSKLVGDEGTNVREILSKLVDSLKQKAPELSTIFQNMQVQRTQAQIYGQRAQDFFTNPQNLKWAAAAGGAAGLYWLWRNRNRNRGTQFFK